MKSAVDISLREPSPTDGKAMWRLAQACESLDRYASYHYVLLCDRFAETCAVASRERELVGYVTAVRPPKSPDVLFVWQVAVAESVREAGLAARLIEHVLARPQHASVRFVEATVCESNVPSLRLFSGLARRLGAPLEQGCGYEASLFAGKHEAERLVRIGPFERRAR
jgi:L-2,4-diaminobutyric acid acetyltransferase